MSPHSKDKLIAAAKMTYGASRCVSGGMLLLGHGLLSHVLTRNCVRIPASRYLIK